MNLGGTCLPCIYPCSTCDSDTNCFECLNNNNDIILRNASPDCNCKYGFVKDSSGICVSDCGEGCMDCVDVGTNNCSACVDGYIPDSSSNICTKCDRKCHTCASTIDNCT